MNNISKYSKYLNPIHLDKLTIHRYKEIKNDDGTTDEILSDDPSLVDISCRASILKEDEHNLRIEDINIINTKYKIFCSPDVDIRKGDTVTLKIIKNNIVVDEFKGIASKPIKYNINQEFILFDDRKA